MKVIFLDIDGVLQPYNSRNRFETNLEMLSKYLSVRYQRDYTIYNKYDVGACFLDWDKDAVKRIKTILNATNARIVMSTGWRSAEFSYRLPYKMIDLLYLWNMEKYWIGETDSESGYRHFLQERYEESHKEFNMEEYENLGKDNMKNAKVYVKRYEVNPWGREVEIIDFLLNHEDITNYVVIDDMYLKKELFAGHFVQTDYLINDENMFECIRILNSNINFHHELNEARRLVL
ncbi:MAG: hypothetical protein LUG12_04895 [Erysipelotrichaceae bacterium]|nr:hypothetical protein [Erysipelotrichaceae bacterium]